MTRNLEQIRCLLSAIDESFSKWADAELLQLVDRPAIAASPDSPTSRWQDRIIEQLIEPKSAVLDLGCGDGQLLSGLILAKKVRGQGVELDAEAVMQCVARGVPVFQSDLDAGLKGFADRSFDYVVLEETMQTLRRPLDVLGEMLRVGRRGIVSFPNFGYWRVRLDLALRGTMPITHCLPYRWYDTPNIHLFSLDDFLGCLPQLNAKLLESHVLSSEGVRPLQPNDNIFAQEILCILTAGD
ncbi:MAG: methionine biosynthesis protein MetW [Phycisphaerales bacterium]|jgi:methionine biosynthesis protein MetW|nr:methionine biosynthesis protein MetW [Phycisphaerales bacterium]